MPHARTFFLVGLSLIVETSCLAGTIESVSPPEDAGAPPEDAATTVVVTEVDASPPLPPDLGPLAGVAAPASVAEVGEWTDGPAWSLVESALYFTTPSGNGAVRRFFPSDGHVEMVREGASPSDAPVSNAVTPTYLVTADRTHLRSSALDGGGLAVSGSGSVDAGDAGSRPFRWLRSVATRDGYFSYVSDPGDGTDPTAPGRIFMECPEGRCLPEWRWIVDETWDGRHPTGLAVTSALTDAGLRVTIYAGYSGAKGGAHEVRAIDEDSKTGTFVYTSKRLFGLTDVPQGVAVDEAGNVYIAWSGGVDVYAPTGARWGGHPGLAVPGSPTALAFGGVDRKTLYVTTRSGSIYATTVPIAGAKSDWQ